MGDNRQRAAEISQFWKNLKSSTLVKTHRTTKDIQDWMEWSFLANYCCERGHGGAFCASHKQSFLPLSPAIERDTLARRDGWSGDEQSRALAVIQLTSCLVLQTSLMTSLSACTKCDFIFLFFFTIFIFYLLSKTFTEIQTCKISAHFCLVWINGCNDIHEWFNLSLCHWSIYFEVCGGIEFIS